MYEIFAMYMAGASQHKIAKEFGVCRPLITMILQRKRWAHVPVSGLEG